MKQYSVPVVFGAGLIVLIAALVVLASTTREIQKSQELQAEPEITDAFLLEKQEEYNRLSRLYPSLTEEEFFKLPEVIELMGDSWRPEAGDGKDAFTPISLPLLELPERDYPEVLLEEIQEICGYLRYRTKIEENYRKLTEKLPAYLSYNWSVPDDLGGNIIYLYSRQLNDTLNMVFLTRNDKVETRIFLIQQADERNRVQQLKVLKNIKILDIVVGSSGVILNGYDPVELTGTLFLIGEKDLKMVIKSMLYQENIMSVFQADGDLLIKVAETENTLIVDEQDNLSLIPRDIK